MLRNVCSLFLFLLALQAGQRVLFLPLPLLPLLVSLRVGLACKKMFRLMIVKHLWLSWLSLRVPCLHRLFCRLQAAPGGFPSPGWVPCRGGKSLGYLLPSREVSCSWPTRSLPELSSCKPDGTFKLTNVTNWTKIFAVALGAKFTVACHCGDMYI